MPELGVLWRKLFRDRSQEDGESLLSYFASVTMDFDPVSFRDSLYRRIEGDHAHVAGIAPDTLTGEELRSGEAYW